MRCQEAQVLLSTRRDLNMSQRAELEAHLGMCRVCAAARREEDRVGRLLASLTDPGLAPPPRVAAAVAARAARRSVAARRQRGLALALSLGAVAVFAALLLNIAAGGRPGQLIFGAPPAAETAAQPAALTPAGDDTLYLIYWPDQQEASLLAWRPTSDETLFRVPLGDPPVYMIVPEVTTAPPAELPVPPRDVAISPTGDSLYVIEYGDSTSELVAYDARSGEERWRADLHDYEPLVTPPPSAIDDGGNLSVSPDGVRVFVRGIAPTRVPVGQRPMLELRAFDAAGGRELGEPTRLSDMVGVLPLSQSEVLLFDPLGGGTARGALGAAGPWRYLEQSIAAGVLLPDRYAVRAVTVDLNIVELSLTGEGLAVAGEVDLVERGGFFFEHAAFSADGEVLAVARSTWDPDSGAVGSEIRLYRAGPWREVARHSVDRPTIELAISPAGARVYAALGQAGQRRLRPGPGEAGPAPAPSLPLGDLEASRGALLTLEGRTGRLVRAQPLDAGVVGFLAGR